MRRTFLILLTAAVFFLTACESPPKSYYVPTPINAVSFSLDDSHKKWTTQTMHGSSQEILMEMVPEGDHIENWQEMVANQIVFTSIPLESFFANWKEKLLQADPEVSQKVLMATESEIVIRYQSNIASELAVRKFIQGADGIYMLAYHVRPGSSEKEVLDLWEKIVSESSLVKNPVR